jgi:hypothetical protein
LDKTLGLLITHNRHLKIKGGLLKRLTKAVVERCLEAELDKPLGYKKHAPEGKETGNSRNGRSRLAGFDHKILALLCTGYDYPRYPGPDAGNVRRRSLTYSDF